MNLKEWASGMAPLLMFAGLAVAIAFGLVMHSGMSTRKAFADGKSCKRMHSVCISERNVCLEDVWTLQLACRSKN